jgi:hypothetical protein
VRLDRGHPAAQGFDITQAGLVGGVLVICGIVGAVIIPLFSDFRPVNKAGRVLPGRLTDRAVALVVKRAALAAG